MTNCNVFFVKKFSCLSFLLLSLPLFNACIKDEAANAECDITDIDEEWLKSLPEGFIIGNPNIQNNAIGFLCPPSTDRTALAPRFKLTQGARIYYLDKGIQKEGNGATRNFTTPQIYTVEAEDRIWRKDYEVAFLPVSPIIEEAFEDVKIEYSSAGSEKCWQKWLHKCNDRGYSFLSDYCWDSGNAGYALTGMAQLPEQYPTVSDENGINGKCVRMVTLSTGSFGKGLNMPIAAGNLFIGTFDVSKAASSTGGARKATKFGLQLAAGEPLSLEGYYKYTAGPVFTDIKQNVIEGRRDLCDIYAVLYEVDPNPATGKITPLNGNDVLSSDRIVALARIAEPGEPQNWKFFSEPFVYQNGKTFDEERFLRNGYSIAVVMTSSREGAYFEGSVGSTLYVDEIEVKWREIHRQ